LEYALRPAVNFAVATNDIAMLDELAGFFNAYLPRFTTLGALRSNARPGFSTTLLNEQGPDASKTLPWFEPHGAVVRVRECPTCNLQFLHPAARLIRAIAVLPTARRTATMNAYVVNYAKLIAHDQLFRYAFQARWDYWGLRGLPSQLVDIWDALPSTRVRLSYQRAMLDRDEWMIAAAAELIGAAAADDSFLGIDADLPSLRRIVSSGLRLLQTKRHVHVDGVDFTGQRVTTISYFDGDGDDHPDAAYASDTSSGFPDIRRKQPGRGLSHDVSHITRLPVLLRSLYDNRAATGQTFPTEAELSGVAAQFAYRAFNGSFRYPLLRNFFSGEDGWYRVGYAGRTGTGYPPSRYCSQLQGGRACLTPWGLRGWALLSPWQPDVARVLNAFVKLAVARDTEHVQYRERYLRVGTDHFDWSGDSSAPDPSFLVFTVLAELVAR
jgi:hypothetical protein